jgi:hypothetical protein
MVAYDVQKSVILREGACAMNGVTVPTRLGLRNKRNGIAICGSTLGVSMFVTGKDNNRNVLNSGGERLLDQYPE